MYDICDDGVPWDEARVRCAQRAADRLQDQVMTWAFGVVTILPKGLPLAEEEAELLQLFLAQQRRINLELDSHNGHPKLLKSIARALPFIQRKHDKQIKRAAQRLASSYLDHAIEDTAERFCGLRHLLPTESIALDWRVSLRYMAQQVHRVASEINLKQEPYFVSHRKVELALIAHELAAEVVERRNLFESTGTTLPP